MIKPIKKGDIIRFKPEWMDKGDEKLTFVSRCDEEKGRIDVSALELDKWTFWPMQCVRVDMIEPESGDRVNIASTHPRLKPVVKPSKTRKGLPKA